MTWSIKIPNEHKPEKERSLYDEPYILCIENVFPKTNTLMLEVNEDRKLDFLHSRFMIVGMDLMPTLQPGNIGTQGTGHMDSGGGHWMINWETYPGRAVLVAITDGGVDPESKSGFQTSLGYDHEQKTTYKRTLDFIKTTLHEFKEI